MNVARVARLDVFADQMVVSAPAPGAFEDPRIAWEALLVAGLAVAFSVGTDTGEVLRFVREALDGFAEARDAGRAIGESGFVAATVFDRDKPRGAQ